VTLDPLSEIVVTASGVQALNVAIRCVLNPGDEALLLTPAWPNGAAIIRMDNAVPVEIPLLLRRGHYSIDFDALEAAVTPRRASWFTPRPRTLGVGHHRGRTDRAPGIRPPPRSVAAGR